MITNILFKSELKSLLLHSRGKVRDNYLVATNRLLMVATDRVSAFDVVLDQPIPAKGVLLTKISKYWFEQLADIIPNHLIDESVEPLLTSAEFKQIDGRATLVEKLAPVPIEAVVRGYVAGSAWKEYQANSTICGIRLPKGLRESEELSHPIFTPATKAPSGSHDENVSFDRMACEIGGELAESIRAAALSLYKRASKIARYKGLIIADTKFEFGVGTDGMLKLMDEVLTPDSSRLWAADSYHPGIKPESFDKQNIRDWLSSATIEGLPWDKKSPPPALPQDVISQTVSRYCEVVDRLIS